MKKYSKKQIVEAINHWKKVLKEFNDNDSNNVAIKFQDGMWKCFSLESGKMFFGASQFINVFDMAKKRIPDAIIWANVDGQDVKIYSPMA